MTPATPVRCCESCDAELSREELRSCEVYSDRLCWPCRDLVTGIDDAPADEPQEDGEDSRG